MDTSNDSQETRQNDYDDDSTDSDGTSVSTEDNNSDHTVKNSDKTLKFGKTLPVISISKVRLPNDTEDPKSSIKKIISDYNTKQNKTEKKKQTKKTRRPEYQAVDADLNNRLNIPMDVDIYVQTVGNRSKVMGSLISFDNEDKRYMEKRHNIAIFYYCSDNSVYVITTNSAWTLVQNYRDPEFPQRIADRLLTLDGPRDRSNKPLFSKISKMSERRKVGNKSIADALDEPHISLNYAARLRQNASIYNLKCFQTISKKSPVNVTINYGSVRFQCLIKTDTLPKLIEHLHKIYKKQPTQNTDNKVEKDSSVYKQYLRVPEFQVKTDLDVNLLENLRKSIQENDDDSMENFELMHLKMDEFLDATEFKLQNKKDKREIVIDEVPNLKLVIKTLREQRNSMFDGIRNRENDFRKELKNISISFKGRTPDPIEEQLLNFLEGIIVYNHLYYFRAFKKWYYVSEDFYRQIQDEFVLYLRNCLLDNRDKAHLKRIWKEDMNEGPYNDGYMGEENFLVGDRALTDTHIEIFDLLYYDSNKKITYLYHVKDGFNQSTRVAQDQLCNAALIVRNHFHNMNKKILKEYHGQIMKKYKEYNEKHSTNYSVPEVFETFEKFEKLLSNPSKLVFVYALRTSSPREAQPNKTLTLEQNLKNKIDPSEIAKSIRALQIKEKKSLAKGLGLNLDQHENDDDDLSEDLFQKLILQNYITKIDNGSDSKPKAYVNSSLLLATKEKFSISKDTSNSINEIIYNKILRPYRTYFTSLMAKLSVIKMKKKIEGKYNYKFKICEIMGEKTINSSQSKPKRKSNDLTQTQQKKGRYSNDDLASIPSTSQTL